MTEAASHAEVWGKAQGWGGGQVRGERSEQMRVGARGKWP